MDTIDIELVCHMVRPYNILIYLGVKSFDDKLYKVVYVAW